MENELARACLLADRLTGTAGARLWQGKIASPAAFRLAKKRGLPPQRTAEVLASELTLDGRYFSTVTPERGYLNFTLSDGWYRHVEEAALLADDRRGIVQDSEPVCGFPATVAAFDRRFLTALGEDAAPERAARQDRENPGWLVRYTALRLEWFGSASAPACYPDEGRAVLLAAAALPAAGTKETSRALLHLAEQVWAASPQRLPPRTAEAARRMLQGGISLL